jgi:hypothetical protein
LALGIATSPLAAIPTPARAECAESELSVGITVRRCSDPERVYAVVSADLAAADVAVRVSRSGERGQTVDRWGSVIPGLVAAVQGGSFAFPSYMPRGLTIGEGEPWPDTEDDGALGVLALDRSGAGLIAPSEALVEAQPWMHSAVSGPVIVRAGAAITACEGTGCSRAPRTAAGLSADGRMLLLIVVEGWTAASEGVNDLELAALAREAGAQDAIRIGEGATSLLWTASGQGAIASSDGSPRPTAAFLGLVDVGMGATGDLVGVVERASDTMALPMAQIRVETTDGRTVAMGGTLTARAYWRFTLPERTYVVRASHDGYREGCRVCSVARGRETWCSLFLTPGSGSAECMAPPRGVDAGAFPTADAGLRDAAAEGGVRARGGAVDAGCRLAPARGPGALGAGALGAGGFGIAALAYARCARRRRAR